MQPKSSFRNLKQLYSVTVTFSHSEGTKMFIGILKLELHIPASNSLKHKRMILNSFKSKMRNNFNVSVSEIGDQDKWQRATIVVCQVSPDKAYLHQTIEKLLSFTERFNGAVLLNHEMEIL